LPQRCYLTVFAVGTFLPVEHWGFTTPFIHDARDSRHIIIFAPRSLSGAILPAIVRLQARLVGPPSRFSTNPGSKVILLSPGQALPPSTQPPDLVLLHRATPLWSLPGLVEMRKRPETRFYSFGVAKDGSVGQSPTLESFATGSGLLVVLTPAVFGATASTELEGLYRTLAAAKECAVARVFVHPRIQSDKPDLGEVCDTFPEFEVDQEAVLAGTEQQCVDSLKFLRLSM
jgi:hypothetical protein